MPGEYDNDLLREGIFHYKVEEFDTARNYIERALENADDLQTRAQANYYLSLLSNDPPGIRPNPKPGLLHFWYRGQRFQTRPCTGLGKKIKTHDHSGRVLINGRTGSVHSEIPERGLVDRLNAMLGSQPG